MTTRTEKAQTLSNLEALTTEQIIQLSDEYNKNHDIKLYLIFALAKKIAKLENELLLATQYSVKLK